MAVSTLFCFVPHEPGELPMPHNSGPGAGCGVTFRANFSSGHRGNLAWGPGTVA